MTATYSLNLADWKHYPQAEELLAAYVAKITGGKHSSVHRKVFHNRKISKLDQEKIKAYSQALSDGLVGHP